MTVVFLACLVLAQWDGGYCCGPFVYAWGVFQSDFSHLPSAGVHKEGTQEQLQLVCVYKVQVWTKRCAQGCVYEVRTATLVHPCSK